MHPTAESRLNDWQTLAEWTAAPQAERFAGHFPGNVVVPGAVVLDEVLLQLQPHYGSVRTVLQAKFARAMRAQTPVTLQTAVHGGRLQFRLLATHEPQAPSFCAGVCVL